MTTPSEGGRRPSLQGARTAVRNLWDGATLEPALGQSGRIDGVNYTRFFGGPLSPNTGELVVWYLPDSSSEHPEHPMVFHRRMTNRYVLVPQHPKTPSSPVSFETSGNASVRVRRGVSVLNFTEERPGSVVIEK